MFYTVLVPCIDRTGPCNVAIDIATEAKKKGYHVRILALGGAIDRRDLNIFDEVRKFKWYDIFSMRGVLHTHCLRPDLLGGLIAVLRRCSVVTTVHNYFLIDLAFDHKKWKVLVAWLLWKRAVVQMDRVVCISNSMLRYYKYKIPNAHLQMIYNFRSVPEVGFSEDLKINQKNFDSWLSCNQKKQRLILIFLGSITPRKNILNFIKNFSSFPDLALIVCGEGPLSSELQQFVVQEDLQDRINLLGYVDDPSKIIQNADALVLPSFAEGMPLVALEAARLGKPVLLSNIAVHREIAALGLGIVFDHLKFKDLGIAIQILKRKERTSEDISGVWRKYFSPVVGYSNYEKIFKRMGL